MLHLPSCLLMVLITVLRLESLTVTVNVYSACSSLSSDTAPVDISPDEESIWNLSLSPTGEVENYG